MVGSDAVKDLGAPTELCEVASLDAGIRLLTVKDSDSATNDVPQPAISDSSGVSEDAIDSVDQFLREAIQNPRERLSVLRIEQDIEKFIRDPTRQQMEFHQLPTSYLRLAAHRVAQHYSLHSMVLMDNSTSDSSGSKIIVWKTSECQNTAIRLADIPLNSSTDGSSGVRFAIKQRPQKESQNENSLHSQSLRTNSSKSVEERKEEYNRARARIFNSNDSSRDVNGKSESESKLQGSLNQGSLRDEKPDEKLVPRGASDVNIGGVAIDPSIGSSRAAKSSAEKEPVGGSKINNRVAIFKDREIESQDPDYDRSHERYLQRIDVGFGFSGPPYIIQPMYAPALAYNTEYPQLGTVPPFSSNHLLRPLLPQHFPGPWVAPSLPAGMGYGLPEAMVTPYHTNYVGARSNSGLYLHSAPYSCQQPGMQFIYPLEQVHQPYSQSHQLRPDSSFGLARPQ